MEEDYLTLLHEVMQDGEPRDTRSGETRSMFGKSLEYDLRDGFPAVTTKKLAFNACVGELLWFINGETSIDSLRKRSNLNQGDWTIWSDDARRWSGKEETGKLYGYQWRHCDGDIDQLANLIERIKSDPNNRRLILQSYHVPTVEYLECALPPCHMSAQFYVEDGYLDCMWTQRSCDIFLG